MSRLTALAGGTRTRFADGLWPGGYPARPHGRATRGRDALLRVRMAATVRLAPTARPRNADGLPGGVPPPESARRRVGLKVANATSFHDSTLSYRLRPSPRATAHFRPSAYGKPQRHEPTLRADTEFFITRLTCIRYSRMERSLLFDCLGV